jgi:ABC-type Fe3+ transport system permease subunit
MGGTLGVTLMGVIVNQSLPRAARTTGLTIHQLHGAIRVALASSLESAFLAATIISALVLPIVLVGVRDVRLRRGFEDAEPVVSAAATPPARAE